MFILVSGSAAQTLKRETHNLPVDECSAILVSGSDLCMHLSELTCWMCIQSFLSVVLIFSKVTHNLDKCSAILITGSDLLKHWY